MITSLSGILSTKSPTEITIDVHGVGYAVHIPLSTYEALGQVGNMITIHTYLHVREDALQLFGFATETEREMFRLLISVSGIGPRMAQGILSGVPVSTLRENLGQGNLAGLTTIPGIGKKLAERLVLELRDKVGRQELDEKSGDVSLEPRLKVLSEAILALTSLGYNRATAEKAARSAMSSPKASTLSLEELIKASLKSASR
jgi:Holliday junction DNA helicase RuvA